MFLAQVPSTPGLEVVAIGDLFPDQAKVTCASIGWSKELIAQIIFSQDAVKIMQSVELDVIVEATGDPIVGITHARHAIANRRHIVMVNVEADVACGKFSSEGSRGGGSCLFDGLWRSACADLRIGGLGQI